ncbi:MAG: MFS transporter, partial [Erysipelotrichaceae bacterium]|nr:MFS transporter [Erysipelotrichaceae bacterium]
ASFRIITRFLDKKHIDTTFMIGVFLTVSSTIVLILFDNIAGAIYYGVSNALALVFYDNSYAYISANIISRYDNEMTERIVGRETAMSLGRCVGMGFIVLLSVLLPEDLYLKISVITLSLTPFIVERILIKYK